MLSYKLMLVVALQSGISEASSAHSEQIALHHDAMPDPVSQRGSMGHTQTHNVPLPMASSDSIKLPGGVKPMEMTQSMARAGSTRMEIDHNGKHSGPLRQHGTLARTDKVRPPVAFATKIKESEGSEALVLTPSDKAPTKVEHLKKATHTTPSGTKRFTKVDHLTQAVAATRAARVRGPVLAQLEEMLAAAMSEEAREDEDEVQFDEDEDNEDEDDEGEDALPDWNSPDKSGGASSTWMDNEDFALVGLPLQSGFTADAAGQEKYVRLCIDNNLYPVGCGNANTGWNCAEHKFQLDGNDVDCVPAPNAWGCGIEYNVAQNYCSGTCAQRVMVAASDGRGNMVDASDGASNHQSPTSGDSVVPICGRFISATPPTPPPTPSPTPPPTHPTPAPTPAPASRSRR